MALRDNFTYRDGLIIDKLAIAGIGGDRTVWMLGGESSKKSSMLQWAEISHSACDEEEGLLIQAHLISPDFP